MISPLSFDSFLFNYPVGKATIGENWNEKKFLEEAQDYQLVYLFSEKGLNITNKSIQLVDTKINFHKSLVSMAKPEEIQMYQSAMLKEGLVELAYLSGTYSRFKKDTRLQNQEFQKLYQLWINKAFQKKEILAAPGNAGMVTCSVENEIGEIGLIAVDENHQGKGWGKKLVKAAENKCYQAGAREMLITTQHTNIPACKLYQSLGYTPAEIAYVYHWWKG